MTLRYVFLSGAWMGPCRHADLLCIYISSWSTTSLGNNIRIWREGHCTDIAGDVFALRCWRVLGTRYMVITGVLYVVVCVSSCVGGSQQKRHNRDRCQPVWRHRSIARTFRNYSKNIVELAPRMRSFFPSCRPFWKEKVPRSKPDFSRSISSRACRAGKFCWNFFSRPYPYRKKITENRCHPWAKYKWTFSSVLA